MRNRLYIIFRIVSARGATLVLLALIMAGCLAAPIMPDRPAYEPQLGTDAELPAMVAMARDSTLTYISSAYGIALPQPAEVWSATVLSPSELAGSTTYRLSLDRCSMTITYPVVAPEATVFDITFDDLDSGIHWSGVIDANGQVVKSEIAEDSQTADDSAGQTPVRARTPVVGWPGYIHSSPDPRYDDMVMLLPDGAGAFGVAGADDNVRAQLAGLRDKAGPGALAHFWGELVCGVDDYKGCRLEVEGVRAGPELAGPFAVVEWQGTIIRQEAPAQFDDAFVLSGEYPIWLGIESAVFANGELELADDLAALRDSGRQLRVWGAILCGVPDTNGCQIQVRAFELIPNGE